VDNPNNETIETIRKIEAVSMSMEIRERWIMEYVNDLVNLPQWETKAEDALAAAEHQAKRTLQTLTQARALLARKRPQIAAE
jgi:hypothetical protein